MAEAALYFVTLEYTSGDFGGGSMTLRMTVDAQRGTLLGTAEGTIQEGTLHPPTFSATANGSMHASGFGNVKNVGALQGQAVVSLPPPAIGSYLAPFSAIFAVDGDWSGDGSFTVGHGTYKCDVKKVTENEAVPA